MTFEEYKQALMKKGFNARVNPFDSSKVDVFTGLDQRLFTFWLDCEKQGDYVSLNATAPTVSAHRMLYVYDVTNKFMQSLVPTYHLLWQKDALADQLVGYCNTLGEWRIGDEATLKHAGYKYEFTDAELQWIADNVDSSLLEKFNIMKVRV